MKTDFKNSRCLLLQDGKKQPIAVISCESGLKDINSKLTQAISDNLKSAVVTVDTGKIVTDATPATNFTVTVYQDVKFTENYRLIFIAVY